MSSAAPRDVQQFRSRLGDPRFPCVGAKSAMASGRLEFLIAGNLCMAGHDRQVVHRLQAFATTTASDALFTSQLVLYPDTPPLDELQFEQALWWRLQALHDIDAATHRWDGSVSNDAQSPEFSLSIGGRAFYVVGLHPGSSRPARRFHCAALVFNLHSQFEALRDDGRYAKLCAAITDRDIAYSGSRNPMMAGHGEVSEARQYSGRQVGAGWRCPFSASAGTAADGP
ncbi:MAG: YqcI/YcgG family protein [Frankiaceae bacterium]|nr:YqcI/YcgG family protein [Arenimonas sp.]